MADRKRGEVRLPQASAHPLPAIGPSVILQGKAVGVSSPSLVDVVFVIDTTGSMSDKIEGIIQTCADFVASFATLRLDYQVAIVAFGDLLVEGDRIVVTPFRSNVEGIRRTLNKIPRYSGGGNTGESALEALHAALRLPFRGRSVKVAILVTDEPAHQITHSASETAAALREREVMTFVISPAIEYYQQIAASTGGTWMEVTSSANFSALLKMLRDLASRVSTVVDQVHKLSGGSVKEYLKLGGTR